LIAPEAAINAKDGSALIPTIAFGIPSGAEMAVFLGILVLHGMQPGPLMLAQNQNEIYGLVWALTGACVLASVIGVLLARPLGLITLVDSRIFVPIIVAVAMMGSYAVDRSIENPFLTLAFGILGYVMIRYDYPRLTIVIALVLGATAERNFHQSMMMGDGSWWIFTSRWSGRRRRLPRRGLPIFARGPRHAAADRLDRGRARRPRHRIPHPNPPRASAGRLAQSRHAAAPRRRACGISDRKADHGDGLDRRLPHRFCADRRDLCDPLYVFAATRWRGGRPYWVCLLSAAGTLARIWFLFGWLLRLELYPGLLFGGQ
jgi:hypothetical protein